MTTSTLDDLKDPFQNEMKNILEEDPEQEQELEEEQETNNSIQLTDHVSQEEEVNITVEKSKENETTEVKERPDYINVCVDFPKHATPVECIITATGYRDKIAASGRELRMLQNRLYLIPVDCDKEVNSDEWSDIKVMSDMSSLIDVRYIKDGFACVMPLTHNVKIRQGNRLAILW